MQSTPAHDYEVIIIGGSYAGLSAAMALGRSLRNVLIIDNGKPCNRQTPHSHNFLTQDGNTPAAISAEGKAQVMKYDTVKFHEGLVTDVREIQGRFQVITQANASFGARKILFATGLRDVMPELPGFAECWGKSVLHCPYCHGYEVHGIRLGIISNGDMAFEFCRLINQWSKDLILFTNGKSTLTEAQIEKLKPHRIQIEERPLLRLDHDGGKLLNVVLSDKTKIPLSAVYARPAFRQHCDIPQKMGCELTEQGFIKTDDFQQSTIPGVYAAGDNIIMLRSVANAVASGMKAGAFINKALIDEEF